jgi:hypothetical protein
MKRTYLAPAGLALAAAVLPLVPWPLGPSPLARAADLFDSLPVEGSRFAVLARPVGGDEWNLLVLEQIQSQPQCWGRRPDGLIDPSLNRFDFTGICNRYLDSNGFSLRVSRQDLATTHRLRLQQVGGVLQLQATSPEQPTVLVVGRGTVPRRDRGPISLPFDASAQETLTLERRTPWSRLPSLRGSDASRISSCRSTPASTVSPRSRLQLRRCHSLPTGRR